jgi:uncharacterized repeat protein (TIGR01451 family)
LGVVVLVVLALAMLLGLAVLPTHAAPGIQLEKTSSAGGTAVPGQVIQYTITITNPDPGAVTVSVRDDLPSQVQYVAGSATAASPLTYADNFDVQSWSNNTGTANWAGPWVETNDAVGAHSGDIVIEADGGSNRLRLRAANKSIHRPADVSMMLQPTLRFLRKLWSVESGDWFYLDVYDGGAWHDSVVSWSFGLAQDVYLGEEINLSAYKSANLAIRFRTGASVGTGDVLYVDDVEIYDKGIALSSPPVMTTNLVIQPGTVKVVRLSAVVQQPLSGGTLMTNTATLGGDVTMSDSVTDILQTPILQITKSAIPAVVEAGERITYTVRVTNTGTTNATNVSIYDPVPANTSYVGGSVQLASLLPDSRPAMRSWAALWGADRVDLARMALAPASQIEIAAVGAPPWILTGHTLTPGQAVTVTFAVQSQAPLTNGMLIANTASVTCAQIITPVSASVNTTVHSSPSLTIAKSSQNLNPPQLNPDDTLRYVITLTNDGNGNATGTVVSDTLPANTTFVPGSVVISPPSAGGTAGTPPSIASGISVPGMGGSVTVRFDVKVNKPLQNGTTITNTASTRCAEDATWKVSSAVVDTVVSAAYVVATKSAQDMTGGAPLRPNDVLSYTVVLTNTGTMDYYNLAHDEFVDVLPLANATYVAASHTASSGSITYSAGTITWNGNLLVGQPVTLKFAIRLNTPLPNGTTISNSGTVTYDSNGDGVSNGLDIPSQTNPVVSTVTSSPNIVVTKVSEDVTGGAPLEPGDRIKYTIMFTNTGDMNAAGMVLTDTIPAMTTFHNRDAAPGGGTVVTTTPQIRIEGISLASGASASFVFRVNLDPVIPVGSSITNRAYIGFDSDGNGSLDALSMSNLVSDAVTSSPQFTVSKQAHNPTIVPGQPVTYTIVLTNTGNAPATGVVVSDTLASQLTFVPGSVTISPPAAGGVAGTPPQIATGISAPVGQPITVTLRATLARPLDNGTVITNTASVWCAENATPVLSGPATFMVSSAPNVSGVKTMQDLNGAPLLPGDQVRYTLIVTNTGTMNQGDYAGTEIRDDLPAYTSLVTGTLFANSGTATYNAADRRILWNGALPVDQPVTIVFDVLLDDAIPNGTVIQNRGRMNWDSNGDMVNDLVTHTPYIQGTVLSAPYMVAHKISLDLDGGVFEPGDVISYTVVITNIGNMDQPDINGNSHFEFYDPIFPGLTYKPGTATQPWGLWGIDGTTVKWTGPITAGVPLTLTWAMDVGILSHGTVVTNQAQIRYDSNADGVWDGNDTIAYTNTTSDTIYYLSALHATKVSEDLDGGAPLEPNDRIRYTVIITNTGNRPVTGAVFTDVVPANTTFLNVPTIPAGAVNESTPSQVKISNINIPANGGSVTIQFRVRVNLPLLDGAVISNQGYVRYDRDGLGGYEMVPTDDPRTPAINDPTQDTVTAAPFLVMTKASQDMDGGNLRPGDVLSYTIRITNTGTENATNVSVVDAVPANTTFVPGSVTREPVSAGGAIGSPPNLITGMGIVAQTSVTLTMAVQLNSPLPNGTDIVNTATVNADRLSPVSTVITDTVTSAPIGNVSKTGTDVNGGNAVPGDRINYQVVLWNTGDMDQADNAGDEFWDVLSANATLVPGTLAATSGAVTYNGGMHRLEWNGGVALSTPVTITYSADIALPLNNGASVQNTAYFTYDSNGDNTNDTTVTSSVTHTVVSAALVQATKSSEDMNGFPLRPGDVLSYTVVLENTGTMDYLNLGHHEFVDILPLTDATYVAASHTASSGAITFNTDRVRWNGDLLVGQPVTLTFAIQLDTPLANGTTIVNQGECRYDSNGDGVYDGLDAIAYTNTVTDTVTSAAVMVLTKWSQDANGAPLQPGDLLQYFIAVTNTGDMDVTGMVLTDTIPAHTTFSAAGPPPGGGMLVSTSPLLRITGISLAAGGSFTYPIDVVVNSVVPVGTSITNRAYVFYDADGDGTPESLRQSNQTVDPVSSAPVLSISKSAQDLNGAPLVPGDTVRYTLTINNTGNAPAQNTVVNDPLPANTTWANNVTISPLLAGGVPGTPPNIVTGLTVPVGTPVTVKFDVTVNRPTANGTNIQNQASVTALGAPTPVLSNLDIQAVSAPVLGISKASMPMTVTPGSLMTYTIYVTNTGPVAANNLGVIDNLPPYVTYVPGSAGLKVPTVYADDFESNDYSGNTGNTNFTGLWIETLEDGVSSSGNIRLLSDTGSIRLRLRGDSTNNMNIRRNLGSILAFVSPRVSFDAKAVSLEGGDIFRFEVYDGSVWQTVYTWAGPLDEADYVPRSFDVSAHKSADFRIRFWCSSANAGNDYLYVDNVRVYDGGTPVSAPPNLLTGFTLASGQAITLTLNVTATTPLTDGLALVNEAGVFCYELPVTQYVTATSIVDASVSLDVSKTTIDLNGGDVTPGDTLRYQVLITATGPGIATNTSIHDPLPANTTWVGNVAVSPPGGVTGSPPNVLSGLSVPGGTTATVTYDVQVDTPLAEGTIITNTATISSPNIPAVVSATVSDTVHTAALAISKSADPSPIPAGGVVTYTIRVQNSGVTTATNVVVTDTLPLEVTYIPGTSRINSAFVFADNFESGAYNGSTGTQPWGSNWVEAPADGGAGSGDIVVASESASLRLRVSGTSMTIRRQADIRSMFYPVLEFDRKLVGMEGGDAFTLELYNGSVWTTVRTWSGPADETSYTREVVNLIGYKASNFRLRFGSAAANSTDDFLYVDNVLIYDTGVPGNAPPVLTDTLSIGPGMAMNVSFQGNVTSPLDNGSTITNRAGASSQQTPTPVLVQLSSTISSAPDVQVTKTSFDPSGYPLRPDEILNYTIVLENVGTMNQHDNAGHELLDAIPTNTSYVAASLFFTSGNAVFNAGLNRVEWNGAVNAGQPVTVSFSVRTNLLLVNGTPIYNLAVLSYDTNGDNVNDGTRASPVIDIVTSAPFVVAHKTSLDVDGAPLRPGDIISYTVVFTNVGDMDQLDKAGAEFLDDIPDYTTYIPGTAWASTGAVNYNGTYDRIAWNGNQPVGAPVTVKFAVQLDNPLPNGAAIENTGRAFYDADGEGTTNEAVALAGPVTNIVVSAPKIEIFKTAVDPNGPPLEPGDVLRYEITIENTGNMDAVDMVFTDNIPTHTTYLSVVDLPVGATIDTTSPELRITGLRVDAGTSVTFRLRVRLDLPLPNGTTITNQGLLAYDADGNGSNESLEPTDDPSTPAINDPTVRTVTSGPVLSVMKSSSDLNGAPLGPNDLLEYRVVISNGGKANATGVVVSDTVPANTTWQGAVTIDPPSAGGVIGAPPLIVSGMTVAAQQLVTLTYRVQVQAGVANGTPIVNRVAVQSLEDPTWYSAVLTDTAYAPLLQVSKTGTPNPVDAGEILTYTILVSNTGGYPTGNLSVADTLPAQVAYVPGSTLLAVTTTYADDFESATYSGNTGTRNWATNWVETAGDGGALAGDVGIVTEGPSRRLHVSGASMFAWRQADLTPLLKPTLTFERRLVSLDGPSDYFRVEVWNGVAWTPLQTWTGPANDAGYTTETFDLSAYIVSNARIRFRGGPSNSVDDHLYVDNVMIYDAGVPGGAPPVLATGLTLQPYTTLVATFQVMVNSPLPDGTALVNTASVTSQHFPSPIVATAVNNVHAIPGLSVHKTSVDMNGGLLAPDDVLRYQVVIENSGNADATQVNLVDMVPAYTSWIGNVSISPVSAGGVPGAPPNIATGMTVRGNESVTVTYEVRVDRPVIDGTDIVNTASVSSLQAPGPFTDTITDTVSSPTLLIGKDGSPQPVDAGELVVYTITVTNTGTLTATGVVVTDTLPPQITYVPGTSTWRLGATYADTFSIFSYAENDGTINWTSNWVEQNDDGLPTSGDVGMIWDDGSLRLNVQNANRALWRQANVSYFYNPMLRFERKIVGLEAGKAFYLDVYNGSTWQVAATWFGPLDESSYSEVVVNLGPYKSAATRIRFRAGTTLDSADNLYVDNVEIYDAEQAGGSPGNLVSGVTIPPGVSLVVQLTGRLTSPLPNGMTLPNTGWVRCTEWPVGVSSTFNTQVHSTTVLQVTKASLDVNGGDLQPGDVIRYQVTLENVGNQNQADNPGNELVDAIPANATYVPGSASATSGSVVYNGGANRVEWNGAVNVGTPVVVTFEVQVNNGLPNGTIIANHATSYYDANGDGSNEATQDSNATEDMVISQVTIVATKVSEDLSGGLLEVGDVLRYTIGITNTGSMDQPDTPAHEFVDDLPAHTTYVPGSLSATHGTAAFVYGTTILWDGALPAGGSVTIEFSVTVNPGTPNNTLISNQGAVNYDSNGDGQVDQDDTPKLTDDPRVPGPDNPTEDRVGYAPLLEATKISVDQNGGFLEPGDVLVYTIVLHNIGNAALVNNVDPEFLDNIPALTTYIVGSANTTAGSVTLNPANTQLRWDGSLNPGQATAITFQVTLNSPLAHMTQICNQGTVYYDGDGDGTNESTKATDDPRTPTKDDATCDTIVSGPILSASKASEDVDGGQLLPKDMLRYTVTITNTGNDAAQNVVISDTMPPEVTWFDSVVITPPSAGGVAGAPPQVVTDLTVPAGQTVTVSYMTRVNSPLPNATVITNTVEVTADRIAEPVTATVTNVVSSDHLLALSKAGTPKPVVAGDLLTYTIYYEVIGDEPAPMAVITDRVPANTEFVDASGGITPAGDVLIWNLGTLTAPSTGEVTFTVRVNTPLLRGTAIVNTAYFRDQDGRSASATDTTLVASDHSLALSKLDMVDPVQAGELLTYTLTLDVMGNEPAMNVIISDGIPAGTTFHSASGGSSIESPPIGQLGMVRWTLDSVNPGEPAVVTLTVRVDLAIPNGTSIFNWATALDSQGKGAVASSSTLVENTDLSIAKTVSPATVKSGDVMTYTIGYVNAGPASAFNVRVTDTLPSGLTYGGMAHMEPGVVGPSQVGQDLIWSIGSLGSGASGQLVFTATVNPTGETLRTLTNTAVIGTSTAERNYGNNVSTASNTLEQQINVAVRKESSAGGFVQPGAEIQYTVHVENTGDGIVTGLTISDTVPANTVFVAGSITLDPPGAGTPGFTPPTLASNVTIPMGETVTVRYRVRVGVPLPNGTLIVNTAEARDGGLPVPVQASITDLVQSSHTLSLLKIDTPDPVAAGGLLTYTLQYQAMGNAPATGVVLTDTLPSHVVVESISNGGVQSGNQITWNLGDLMPPATGSVSLIVRVNTPLANGTVLVNRATIADAQGVTASAQASTTVQSAPAFGISKLAPATVRAGDILTYTIVFTNTGNAYATSVVITDTIPAHTEWRSGGHSHTATEVRWNVASMAPGITGYAVFSVRVLPDTPVGTTILNSHYGIRSAEVPAAVLGAPRAVSVAPPTGITLEYFTAKQAGNAVELEWRTATELNNRGFHLYRNTSEDFDSAVRLTDSLIPGQGRGLTGGATYQFLDATAESGRTYYYWLEDIDLNGNVQYRVMRSIAVTVYIPDEGGRKYGIRLPFVWK